MSEPFPIIRAVLWDSTQLPLLSCLAVWDGLALPARYSQVDAPKRRPEDGLLDMNLSNKRTVGLAETSFMMTSLVNVSGEQMPCSVRTNQAIPKRLIPDCVAALRGIELVPPVRIGDVVLADVCGTGADVIATKDFA